MKPATKFYLSAGVVVALAVMLSPWASKSPDGLEKIAQDQGFAERGEGTPTWRFAALTDYVAPGIGNSYLATSIAGVVGAAVVFGAALGVGKLLARKSSDAERREP